MEARLLYSALAGILLATACLQPADANEVLKWNETAAKAAAANGQNPIQTSRTVAMVQGAVHDALNAITPRYAPYYFEGPGQAGASPTPRLRLPLTQCWPASSPASALRRRKRKPSLWSRTPTRRRWVACVTKPPVLAA